MKYWVKIISGGLLILAMHVATSRAEPVNGIDDPKPDSDELGVPSHILEITDIRKHVLLERATKTIRSCEDGSCLDRSSDLQVSAVVYDNGPSTDVVPTATLYLTIYNSVEETGIARSLHQIADVTELVDARRIKAGIYELTYKAFWSENGCFQPTVKARIDARALSAKMRAAKEVGFLEDHTYTDTIDVVRQRLDCPVYNR